MNHAHVWLVADDHSETLEAAEDVCKGLGYRAVCVGSQEELFLALERQRFCGVLLDLELGTRPNSVPRIEVGWTTLERLGKENKRDELPVVVMTAHGHDHRHPAKATLLEAAAFLKKPFGGDGDLQPEEVLKRVMAKTCEARFPECCPNYDAPKLEGGKKRKKQDPRVKRLYRGKITIHLDGRRKKRLCRIVVGEQEKWIRNSTFEVLYHLAHALRTEPSETFYAPALGADYNHQLSRAVANLREKAGIDPLLIENDGHKGYRLSVPPENVTCDQAAVRTHHMALHAKAPWA